jgi:ligand-binding sensor domain-containing protein
MAAIKILLMKQSVCILVMLLHAILTVQSSLAQFSIINNAEDKFRAVHWSLDEGLSNAEVYYIIKDIKGFLWIGTTNGLNRFDGSRFKIFFHDPQNPSTIPNNEIFGLVEDSLHNIWIGTGQGLSRYDISADTLTNFSGAKHKINGHNAVRVLCATRNLVYCLETGNYQVAAYDVHSLKKKDVLKLTAQDRINGVSSGSYSFLDAQTNSFWMLYGKGAEAGLLKI